MVFEYTEDMFDRDKREMLEWLSENWTWRSKWSNYLQGMLFAMKNLIEEWKRE